jgi:hypothetical protein
LILPHEPKTLGPDNPSVGQRLNNLVNVYQDQDRDAKAESLMKRALAIHETALGPDHPDVRKDSLTSSLCTKSRVVMPRRHR